MEEFTLNCSAQECDAIVSFLEQVQQDHGLSGPVQAILFLKNTYVPPSGMPILFIPCLSC